jgi:hypothetical protein
MRQTSARTLSVLAVVWALANCGCGRAPNQAPAPAPAKTPAPVTVDATAGWTRMIVQHQRVRYSIAVPLGTQHHMYQVTEDLAAVFKSASIVMHLIFAGPPVGDRGVEVTTTMIQVDGHRTQLVTFEGSQEPWPHTRWVEASIADVEPKDEPLAAIANCADAQAQTVAKQMIRSIRFLPPVSNLPPIPPPPS